ncbi:hypothetical protein BJY04DRAFT_210847 [Aspergillus karnatakaensis]|uniref:uncharacterized protein n=1 Tax=Aspergillus karnatakaensis TaxID=1810916 RepID=UPI003CCDA0FA
MLSQLVTAAKGLLFAEKDSNHDATQTSTESGNASIASKSKMVTTRQSAVQVVIPVKDAGVNGSAEISSKRKSENESATLSSSETQGNKRRKRSSIKVVEEVREESKEAAPGKHMRFDSEEPEMPEAADVEASVDAQQKAHDDEDSSDDEAPETVDNSAQLSRLKSEAKKREQARQLEEQLKREKRRQLDESRKQQAKTSNKRNAVPATETAPGAGTPADDMLSESSATLQGSFTQDARRSTLPALLPDDILNAVPDVRPPTPPPETEDFRQKKPTKLRFLDKKEKAPKDVRMGDVAIRVLDSDSARKQPNGALPPKTSKTGKNAKSAWLKNARSTGHVNGMRMVSSSKSFVRNTYHDNTSADPTFRPLSSGSPSASNSASHSRSTGLSALNSKLRRRNSHGATGTIASSYPTPKVGPQRTTKTAQKLKLLPDPVTEEELDEETSPSDVYRQIARIKEPAARSLAAKLGKADRDRLPRVTAYCTANTYRLDGVFKWLKSRNKTRGANPKLFDECVYSRFDYQYEEKQKAAKNSNNVDEDNTHTVERMPRERRFSDSVVEVNDNNLVNREELIDLHDPESHSSNMQNPTETSVLDNAPDIDTTIHAPEVFLFDYGTVVIWGMSPAQESRFLSDISKFATSILSPEDTQVENFNFYYAREYQARIYNDFISLRDPRNYMIKLAISHALAQSVKTSLFEDLVSETISNTAPLPAQIAQTGSVNLTRRQINMQVGELFILRINIHLQGSVLDSPELMWAEPQLEPVYQAVRSYLEMDQRVTLLTERLDVIADLLAVLKDQLTHRHGEYLEWIVIVLIAAEILVAAINIVVDLYAGVE